jgi:hypothetical protein
MAIEWLAGNRLRGTTAERPEYGLPSGSVGGWVEVGRTTLGSNANNIDITSLSDKRYYMVLNSGLVNGTYVDSELQFNSDTGSNYADRQSLNGAADGTRTSSTYGMFNLSSPTQNYSVNYISNLSAKEKLVVGHAVDQGTAGAANAPRRREWATKWTNTSSVINKIDIIRGASTGQYTSGTEVVVLGWDPDDTHTTNFWQELADVSWSSGSNISTGTFTSKKYLWIQIWYTTSFTGGSQYVRVGNSTVDTGSNYAHRYSINGGADGTGTSGSNGWFLDQGSSAAVDRGFVNLFMVNNASNEKIGVMHDVWSETDGASTAPERNEHAVKWANTSNQINIVDLNGLGSGDYSGGQIKVWGSD